MAVSVAIASGKGGVGKTTTASNLAIYYAEKGLRVALLDIDPLSNVAVALDLPKYLFKNKEEKLKRKKPLESYTVNILPNFDLLFPITKTATSDSILLYDLLSNTYNKEINDNYDILIYDMPAGLHEKENLNFLSLVSHLVLVVNPEPVSHVAAGTYLKKSVEINKKNTVHIWHNRYKGYSEINFDSIDVIGNYNRNMPKECVLDPEDFDVLNTAFIPEDRSMDLLHGDPEVLTQLLRNMSNFLDILHTDLLQSISCKADISNRMMVIIKFYFKSHSIIQNPEDTLVNLVAYIAILSGITIKESKNEEYELFTENQKNHLINFINTVKNSSLRKQILKTDRLINQKIASIESEFSLYSYSIPISYDPGATLDKELSVLLIKIQKSRISALKNGGGLLLFYFSLYKLFQSEKLLGLVLDFIPRKKKKNNYRDRYTQIQNLFKKDNSYKNSYLKLIKTLLPLVSKQISTAAKTFELDDLVFRDSNGVIIKAVYLKLTSSFIHEIINGGLGIIINFDHRPASRIFTKSADKLLKQINYQDKVLL